MLLNPIYKKGVEVIIYVIDNRSLLGDQANTNYTTLETRITWQLE